MAALGIGHPALGIEPRRILGDIQSTCVLERKQMFGRLSKPLITSVCGPCERVHALNLQVRFALILIEFSILWRGKSERHCLF